MDTTNQEKSMDEVAISVSGTFAEAAKAFLEAKANPHTPKPKFEELQEVYRTWAQWLHIATAKVIVEQGGEDPTAFGLMNNGACKGYAAAAAIGAGLTNEQTERLLANLEAAFDNMSVEEAEALYTSDEWRA